MNKKYIVFYINAVCLISLFLSCNAVNFTESMSEDCTGGDCYNPDTVEEICGDNDDQCRIVENFKIGAMLENRPIDFIFVVDASGSMKADLLKLGHGFSSLISQIEEMDWRMMFTLAWSEGSASDGYNVYTGPQPYNGQFMKPQLSRGSPINQYYLDKHTSDYEQVFLNTLVNADFYMTPGIMSKGPEQPLRSLKFAFERLANGDSYVPLRENADVVVIIITDTDECSADGTWYQPRSPGAATAHEVVNAFRDGFPEKQLLAFSVLIKPGDSGCLRSHYPSGRNMYGIFVSELSGMTEGKNISICESDYSSELAFSSRIIRVSQEGSVKLSQKPSSVNFVQVEFLRGSQVPWDLDGREIQFERDLDPGTEIRVTYEVNR